MFFSLSFVTSHPIYNLHDAMTSFMTHCGTGNNFDLRSVPNWFQLVIGKSPALLAHLERVSELIIREDAAARKQILEAFNGNNKIRKLCQDKKAKLVFLNDNFPDLDFAVRDLFRYLYDETINTKVFQQHAKASIYDHYIKFRALNQSVCPFCTSEYYPGEESGTRASYDHYLSRGTYPFSGINFYNLIPMCERCNGPVNKGTKNILFPSSIKTRRKAFFPYGRHKGVKVSVSCLGKPSLTNKGTWEVGLESRSSNEKEEMETWASVFNIRTRLKDKLREQNEAWALEFIGERYEHLELNVTSFRKELRKKAVELSRPYFQRMMQDSVLKAAFYSYLANDAETATIRSYCAIAKTRYISDFVKRGSRNRQSSKK